MSILQYKAQDGQICFELTTTKDRKSKIYQKSLTPLYQQTYTRLNYHAKIIKIYYILYIHIYVYIYVYVYLNWESYFSRYTKSFPVGSNSGHNISNITPEALYNVSLAITYESYISFVYDIKFESTRCWNINIFYPKTKLIWISSF